MAALAYLLLPFSGLIAYMLGSSPRTRRHGLQAIVLGVLWPAALYGASLFSAGVTQVTFVVGAVLWIGVIVLVATGRDVSLPLIGSWLDRAAEADPRGRD